MARLTKQITAKKKKLVELNSGRHYAGVSAIESKKRRCLFCSKYFQSWQGERRCQTCREKLSTVSFYHEGW